MNASLKSQKHFLRDTDNFLISYIKLIPKASDANPTLAKSYRPISVSHTLTILVERVLMLRDTPASLHTDTPENFYGYIGGRSVDMAVETLKRLVYGEKNRIKNMVLVTLDASAAFEGVKWDKIFSRLASKNNPKIIRIIWLFYKFNRYECRWKKLKSNDLFCATIGTKQGGVISGYIFVEYMNILNEQLQKIHGIRMFNKNWNSLKFADDVLLIGKNLHHAQQLLNVCEWFTKQGFIKWNASKTKVIELTDNRKLVNIPKFSKLMLNDTPLERTDNCRWLGYILNHKLNDDDHIKRQSTRLNALTNNLRTTLPLNLINDSMLRKLTLAYGNIYLLPVLRNSTKEVFKQIRKSHRNMTAELTQYYQRSKLTFGTRTYLNSDGESVHFPHWDPENGQFERGNRFMYSRIRIPTVDSMIRNQARSFEARYWLYVNKIGYEAPISDEFRGSIVKQTERMCEQMQTQNS